MKKSLVVIVLIVAFWLGMKYGDNHVCRETRIIFENNSFVDITKNTLNEEKVDKIAGLCGWY